MGIKPQRSSFTGTNEDAVPRAVIFGGNYFFLERGLEDFLTLAREMLDRLQPQFS
ncbi:hypothetical protein BN871_CZ_00070 [Paenibacillus sp. P22]|nr:hypothetical protein BN871_CZ_00070 [Paenibacillus sp. P22]